MTNKIKQYRKKCGLVQYYVAERLGISTRTLYRIENNKRKITDKECNILASIFNCGVEELRQN